jgi:signal transduction histidine kinase
MDPSDLERIALNLVANARDALPCGGRVQLSTLCAHATLDGAAPTSDWVIFEVRDNGSGMDEATRARACEPFFTTKPGEHGTGLGLSGVATAARAAGGRVHIESELGEGTTVQVWLPASVTWERAPVPMTRAKR